MLCLHVTLPLGRWLELPWTLLGVVPLGLGAILHAWALRTFRDFGTTAAPTGRPRELVRRGPYARTRNPMYLAGIPILAGCVVLLGTTAPVLVALLYPVAASRWIEREEVTLLDRFGNDWRRYRESVPRWL